MKRITSIYSVGIEKFVMLLLLIYPVCMLMVRGGMNAVFILMLLLTIVVAVIRPSGLPKITWCKEWTYFACSMLSMTIATLLSQVANHQYGAHAYDAISRYWLAVPILLLMQRIEVQIFEVLRFAFPIAAIVGLASISEIGGGRYGISSLDLIHFGDFELLLGVLSLHLMKPHTSKQWYLSLLGWCGLVAGIAASLLSGSRGGWLAIPVFVIIYFSINNPRNALRTISITFAAAVLAIAVLLSLSDSFSRRMSEMAQDFKVIGVEKSDSDTGIRLQLYVAAAEVFFRHPLFGVGPEGFALEMQPMLDAGKITPQAANYGRGEVHSDLLAKAAGMGTLGVAALLATYLVPLWLFLRVCHSGNFIIRRAALSGVTFIVGFMIFGLTVEFLSLTLVTAFYSFTLAVLLAVCYNIHHPLNQGGKHV